MTFVEPFVNLVRDNPGTPLALEIERQGSPLSLTLIPPSPQRGEGERMHSISTTHTFLLSGTSRRSSDRAVFKNESLVSIT
jgi:hypothetical protein